MQRILNLSAGTAGAHGATHGSHHSTDIPRSKASEVLLQQDQSLLHENRDAPLPQPSRMQELQILTNNVDIPNLSKIIAFKHQKEANQNNQLITSLRSDLKNKEDGLAFVLGKHKEFEVQLETAHHHIESLQKRIEILEQQQEEGQESDTRQVNVLHYLKAFDHKLDLLIKQRPIQESQQDDRSQIGAYTKQMTNDHPQQIAPHTRGARSMQNVEETSIIAKENHMVIENKTGHAAESQELSYVGGPRHGFADSSLDNVPAEGPSQVNEPQDDLIRNTDESQEVQYIGKERQDLDCSQLDGTKSSREIPPPSTPTNKTPDNQAMGIESRQGSTRSNKFYKRKRSDDQGDNGGDLDDGRFKRPANHVLRSTSKTSRTNTNSQKVARQIDTESLRETKPLAERNINTLQIQPSKKPKSARGPGGG